MKPPVPSSCAIWEVWDAAGGSLAAAGAKKLSKAWGGLVLATELEGGHQACLLTSVSLL